MINIKKIYQENFMMSNDDDIKIMIWTIWCQKWSWWNNSVLITKWLDVFKSFWMPENLEKSRRKMQAWYHTIT